MGFLPAQRLLWRARQCIGALGWPGLVATLLLALCMAFHFFALQALRENLASLQREADTLRLQSKTRPAQQKVLSPAGQLAEFYQFFPKQDAVPDGMAVLYKAAAQHNLTLEQGEYRLAQERDGRLVRYDMTLPVKGGYVNLRKFMAQVLHEAPNLSLEGVTFSRQKIDDAALDAQFRFTLYLGR